MIKSYVQVMRSKMRFRNDGPTEHDHAMLTPGGCLAPNRNHMFVFRETSSTRVFASQVPCTELETAACAGAVF